MLRFEESTRLLVAYEMWYRGSFFQPTIFGELYYKKPPLFNWLVILSSELLGWEIFTLRAVSLLFNFLSGALTFIVAYVLWKDLVKASLAFLIFVSFADVLFWYGWLGEIDITYTFFVFLTIVLLWAFFSSRRYFYLYLASFFSGLNFMIKGFPAFAFYVLTIIAFLLLDRSSIRLLFNVKALVASMLIMLATSFVWLLFSADPQSYLLTLWNESFGRVKSSKDMTDVFIHIVSYPILNVKQTLPASLVVILTFFLYRKSLEVRKEHKLLFLLFVINYIPYLLTPAARGRYILPLLPILALLMSELIYTSLGKRIYRLFILLVAVAVGLRFVYGFFILPVIEERAGNPRIVGQEIASIVKNSEVVCDCLNIRDICLYVGLTLGRPVFSPSVVSDWSFYISCKEHGFPLVKEYKLKGRHVYVYSSIRDEAF